jgi:outer membrane protein TolC
MKTKHRKPCAPGLSVSRTLAGILVLGAAALAQAGEIAGPADLPPRAAVLATLAKLPAVAKAEARLDAARAEHARLRAGPHEYTVTLQGQRRDISGRAGQNEWQASIERGLRLPGKAELDDRIGAQGAQEYAEMVGDARHEAARQLLAQWYAARRARVEADTLRAQLDFMETEAGVVARRVKAGDAARMDTLQADAALSQARARWRQADARAQAAEAELRLRYPELPAPGVANAEPTLPPGGEAEWLARTQEHNHEILALQRALEGARLRAQRADRDRLPDPTLGLHLASEADGDERVLGVSLAMPLPGSARRAEIALRGAEAQAIAADEVGARRRIEIEARANWRNAEAGVRDWRELRLAAEAMARHAGLARRAHELGELGLTESLLAQRGATDALLTAEQARLNANEAIARLLLDAHALWPMETEHDEH